MNRNPEVDKYLENKKHPLSSEIQQVRQIILTANPRIEEVIKWSSPTSMYKGNIASFFINAKKFVSLMFRKGALLTYKFGLLEGDGKEARVARFENQKDVDTKKQALQSLIAAWIKMQDQA